MTRAPADPRADVAASAKAAIRAAKAYGSSVADLAEAQRAAMGRAELLRSIDRRLERTNDLLARIARAIDRGSA